MRSMASGAAFHRAYPCATQQAFLEAHELAFAYFEGVFRRLRYDNLSSAVKKILRGQQRELTSRFIAFRSHWQYQAEFCTPSEGHEKGGVEGEVGYFRRNHWVPVPVAADLQALNRKLLEDCRADESRIVSGQTECVGTRLLVEKEHLLPLATDVFDLAEVSYPRIDQTGCAKVRTNSYSVPLKPGSIVEARVYSCTVEFRHHGNRIASHERCYSRLQKIFDLKHYLEVLDRKPGVEAWSVARIASLAEEAGQRKHSHLHYLEALLQAEMEDRERRSIELRMKEAHLPRIKTLEEFDFIQSPHIPAARIHLARVLDGA